MFFLVYILHPESEFVDVIGTEVLRVFLLAIQSPLPADFTPPTPPRERGLKLVCKCNINIVFENLKSENSQDYAQKPQRNFTVMNSASGVGLV